ncbi:MAG: hypothetical protein WCE69_04980 [Aestuariivirga sp.]
MLSRRRFCLELLAGLWLVAGSRGAFAESGPGSDGSGGGNDDGGNDGGGNDDGGNDGGGDNHGGDNDADDQDEARKAVIRGDATALRDILRQVRRQYSGEIVHVGLNQRLDGLDYMIKLIDPGGKLILLRVDAKSGAILAVRGE